MPTTVLTNKGVQKITQAAGSNAVVQISHIALGDGSGVNYAPSYSQTALRREKAREAITRKQIIGTNTWRVKAEFDADTPTFWVREIGFFDADGDLIALWAGTDVDPRQTGAITYLIDHVLTFSRVQDGVIIVNAPDDELFGLSVQMLRKTADDFVDDLNRDQRIEALLSSANANSARIEHILARLEALQTGQNALVEDDIQIASTLLTSTANLTIGQLDLAAQIEQL